MRNGITTIAATPADAAAETADSTASPVTAITSVPAAAAITASGERANISFVSFSVEPDVFRKNHSPNRHRHDVCSGIFLSEQKNTLLEKSRVSGRVCGQHHALHGAADETVNGME